MSKDNRDKVIQVLEEARRRAGTAKGKRFEPFLAVLKGDFRSLHEKALAVYICKYFLDNYMFTFVKEAEILAATLREALDRLDDANFTKSVSPEDVAQYYELSLSDFLKVAYEFCELH